MLRDKQDQGFGLVRIVGDPQATLIKLMELELHVSNMCNKAGDSKVAIFPLRT